MTWLARTAARWRQQPISARVAQVLAFALFLWGATCGDVADITIRYGPPVSDIDNQAAVLARMAAGEPYYPVVFAETRRRGYPTNSPFNVRLPTVVWFLSLLPSLRAATGVLLLIAVVTTALWCTHLLRERRWRACLVVIPLTLTMTPIWLYERAIHLNDLWAGQLMALSLAARVAGFVPVSLAAAGAAVLVRELALPFVFAMAVAAFWTGHRRELWGWAVVGGLALAALAWHMSETRGFEAVAGPSNQWVVAGGWCFALRTARMNPLFMHLPNWIHALAVSLLLAGAWTWRASAGRWLAISLTTFLALFLLVGRPDNAYWGLLIAPMLPLGALGWARR